LGSKAINYGRAHQNGASHAYTPAEVAVANRTRQRNGPL